MINWGKRSDGNEIVISTSVITDAYNEIATWRKNVFLVPYGKVGRDFIDQVTAHISESSFCASRCRAPKAKPEV